MLCRLKLPDSVQRNPVTVLRATPSNGKNQTKHTQDMPFTTAWHISSEAGARSTASSAAGGRGSFRNGIGIAPAESGRHPPLFPTVCECVVLTSYFRHSVLLLATVRIGLHTTD